MKSSEQAISEGFFNPPSRLILLFVASYIAGIFYPPPQTVFHLIKGPTVEGNTTTIHTPDFVDLAVMPFILSPFAGSSMLAFPVSVFCIVISALDRWKVEHVTALGAASTFSMGFAWDVASGRIGELTVYALSTIVLMGIYYVFASRLAEHGVGGNPSDATT